MKKKKKIIIILAAVVVVAIVIVANVLKSGEKTYTVQAEEVERSEGRFVMNRIRIDGGNRGHRTSSARKSC